MAATLAAAGPSRAHYYRQAPVEPALCCRDNRGARRAGSQAGSAGGGLAAVGHVRRAGRLAPARGRDERGAGAERSGAPRSRRAAAAVLLIGGRAWRVPRG